MLRNTHKYSFVLILIIITILTGCSSVNREKTIGREAEYKKTVKSSTPPAITNKVKPVPPISLKHNPIKTSVIETISVFKTKLLDKTRSRIFNIKKAAKKINSFTLESNAIFSFNKVVGERSPQKGYKTAKILVEGERDEAVGGGICQLSSTIYNAILPLKFEVIERHTHTGEVHYLPLGMDAAVDYNNLDLKFKNIKVYPVKFKVYIKSGYLFVEIIKINI